MARYIFLRDTNEAWPKASPFLNPSGSSLPQRALQGIAAPHLEIVDLDPQHLRDAQRDPDILAFARVMPTRLVGPEPLDDIRPEDAIPGWGFAAMGADHTPYDGAGVRVALLDTGIDSTHPTFVETRPQLQDFAGSGVEDANGNGTHLAGGLFGRDQGGQRIGVARGVTRPLIAKAIKDDGLGSSDAFLQAVLWAVEHQAQVIAFALAYDAAAFADSLAAEGYPTLLAQTVAIEAERTNLALFQTLLSMLDSCPENTPVVLGAVGNDSRRTVSAGFETGPVAPAAARGVMAVTALGQTNNGLQVAPFCNTSPQLAAPGVGIVSASPGGGLRAAHGSAIATAYAAGVAALWWQALIGQHGSTTAAQVLAYMCQTAQKDGINPALSPMDYGFGLVRAPRTTDKGGLA